MYPPPESERIVRLEHAELRRGGGSNVVSSADFPAWREPGRLLRTGDDEVEVPALTPSHFALLRTPAVIGRFFIGAGLIRAGLGSGIGAVGIAAVAKLSFGALLTLCAAPPRGRALQPACAGPRARLPRRRPPMKGSAFDEAEFFRSIDRSGARALLIGRRALVILGLPVLTADYDFWIHADDALIFNAAAAPFELLPTSTPQEARARGRYVLENDEHVDVLVAREIPTVEGQRLRFDDLWARRRTVQLTSDVRVHVPGLDDLIATKKVAARPKDVEDLRLLMILRDGERP